MVGLRGLRRAARVLVCIGSLACVCCEAISGLDRLEKQDCTSPCSGAVDGSILGDDVGFLDVLPNDGPQASDSTASSDSPATLDSQDPGDVTDGPAQIDGTTSDAPSVSDARAAADTGSSDAMSAADSEAGIASDGSVADAGTDGPTVSFTNPVSIDVRALLVSNTVVTTANGGVALTPIDGAGGGRDFPTRSKAIALNAAGVGLPDNALFPSNGLTIPTVQLAWSNASNAGNSLVIPCSAGTSRAFDVPPGKYRQLQIYATAANGSSALNITLTYASGNPLIVNSIVTVLDWCTGGAVPAGEYTLTSAHRVKNQTMLDPTMLCSIYAIDLNPDPARSLTKVAFVAQGPAAANVVFYGATAW